MSKMNNITIMEKSIKKQCHLLNKYQQKQKDNQKYNSSMKDFRTLDIQYPEALKLGPTIKQIEVDMLDELLSFSLEPTELQELDMIDNGMQELNINKESNNTSLQQDVLCKFFYTNQIR